MCTHGSTIGQLEEEELFYLQTRGLSREDSHHLLARGFVEDVLEECSSPALAQAWRESILDQQFHSNSKHVPTLWKDRRVISELAQKVHNKRLVYLDNGATTLKPKQVVDFLHNFYRNEYATVHRGAYQISEKATMAFEGVREKVAKLIHAPSENDIIYTRGTTESINWSVKHGVDKT